MLARAFVRAVLVACCVTQSATAQEGLSPRGDQDRGPRFFIATGGRTTAVDGQRVAELRRRITTDLVRAPLPQVLREIAAQAGLRLAYSPDVVRLDRRVSLQARNITVAAALTEVLVDEQVDVVVAGGNQLGLVRRGEAGKPRQAAMGSITGRVVDAKSGDALSAAEVFLEGTRWRASTSADGRYRLAEVEAGSYTLTARRLGYAKQSRAIAVAADQEVTVDITLQPVATQLNEIVTTVTGEQRRVELGHVVGRINADSVVKEAPVSSLSELLNGRVSGLQVFQSQGTVGGQVRLQIRGPNSLFLNSEPIVIVDGVRHTTARSGSRGEPFASELTSRLNDLNPNDIETVEVVKGPSAATLYGTDAANGVLVITTKRGRPGPARWNVYGKGTKTAIPTQEYPDRYFGWGTVFGVPSNPSMSCSLDFLASGFCTQQDSVTLLPNPLNDPGLTIFGSKPRWEYGVNVAGGQQAVRYYFSGDFEDATGPIQMPLEIAEQLKQRRGLSELPEEWRHPNAFTKLNLRANVNAALSATTDLRVNTGYVRSATRSLATEGQSVYEGAFNGGVRTPYSGDFKGGPDEAFLKMSTDRIDRFFGNVNGEWRPVSWLAARATVGLDLTGSNRYNLARRADVPSESFSSNGIVADERIRQLATTAELGATATARRGRLSARTSIGAQYVRNLSDVLYAQGRNLPPGGSSVGEATNLFSRQSYAETVTLGGYVEETLGLNERFFLTGALRADGASAFGQDYDATVYPKVSASWLLSEEPFLPRLPELDEFRLRYAFGASGQQSTMLVARPKFGTAQYIENGVPLTGVRLTSLGNPELRPERVREHEFGVDAAALGNRFRLGFTWYRRRTVDQILSLTLPPGLSSISTNLGLTTQRGFELDVTARLLDTRLLSWDLALQHGSHTTKLVDLGSLSSFQSESGGFVKGYPLGARFQRPLLGFGDANGDGIITQTEVQLGDTAVYVGQSAPPRSQILTTVLGLFERRLRLSALLERRTGFSQINALDPCTVGMCRALLDPSTPLAEQAQALPVVGLRPERADFTRLREVTAALELPAGWMRALRVRSATLALSVRNLALWTDFSGPDPESSAPSGGSQLGGALTSTAAGIPQGRSWTLRLDLGL